MFGSLKWLVPFYWPIGIVKAMVDVPLWTLSKVWDLTKAGWHKLPKPKSTAGKMIVYPLYAYIAVPGSVPYALYKFAELFGYREEMDTLVAIFTGMFGGLGSLFLDAVGKALLFTLASLFTLVS